MSRVVSRLYQVQGAFVMGLGHMLSEEFLWDDGSKSAYFPGLVLTESGMKLKRLADYF